MLNLLFATWFAAPALANEVSVGVDLGTVDLVAVIDLPGQEVVRRPVVVARPPVVVRRPVKVVPYRVVRPAPVVYAAPVAPKPAPRPAVHTPNPVVVHRR